MLCVTYCTCRVRSAAAVSPNRRCSRDSPATQCMNTGVTLHARYTNPNTNDESVRRLGDVTRHQSESNSSCDSNSPSARRPLRRPSHLRSSSNCPRSEITYTQKTHTVSHCACCAVRSGSIDRVLLCTPTALTRSTRPTFTHGTVRSRKEAPEAQSRAEQSLWWADTLPLPPLPTCVFRGERGRSRELAAKFSVGIHRASVCWRLRIQGVR